MGESKLLRRHRATREWGTGVPSCSLDSKSRFAIAAYALWPRKTAAQLAYHAKVTERAAKHWLSGDREPSFDAIMAIVNEIRTRR